MLSIAISMMLIFYPKEKFVNLSSLTKQLFISHGLSYKILPDLPLIRPFAFHLFGVPQVGKHFQ
jgi:hypothetical protein